MERSVFSNILRELLDTKGMSQKQLAVDCETTEATISRYISGVHKPELAVVVKIAQVLNVSIDYLCGLTDLSGPKELLGAELTTLIRCFERASQRDKRLVWGILEDYMISREKGSPFWSSYRAETETA